MDEGDFGKAKELVKNDPNRTKRMKKLKIAEIDKQEAKAKAKKATEPVENPESKSESKTPDVEKNTNNENAPKNNSDATKNTPKSGANNKGYNSYLKEIKKASKEALDNIEKRINNDKTITKRQKDALIWEIRNKKIRNVPTSENLYKSLTDRINNTKNLAEFENLKNEIDASKILTDDQKYDLLTKRKAVDIENLRESS